MMEKYDDFLNNRLQVDLEKALEEQDGNAKRMKEFEGLRENVKGLRERKQDRLRTMVELGAGVLMQAEVPDCTWIYVDIGMGFHVECTMEEAEKIAESRVNHFSEQVNRCTQRIGSIRAHIKLISQALSITRQEHTTR